MNPNQINKMRLPLTFIRFAFIEGKMFSHFRQHSTFVVQGGRPWGNSVVYGAIFLLKESHFYLRILDAYHGCSLDTLKRNHVLDLHHRIDTHATPIRFDSIESLECLKYQEDEPVLVQTYVGNTTHPKLNQRLTKTNSYRIIDGVSGHFLPLYREVTQ